ncbi:hypothetical protein [Rhizobium sp. C4]|uniref:hypothetical protein n=1 Tax=Rhizobium sp. C4 TaxID=1349800 RepID=UPI001E5F7F80|nr:hypothetical protein [Rhizobium sp. C4]MCD2171917.1 hypothetical protein [Rhizobium sp. C4]
MAAGSRHQTQWAAQFAVASELCKLGCDVGFTMGHNTPLADLFVLSPDRKKTFLIDVKGQKSKNFWQIKKKEPTDNLFYVLAYVPAGASNRFFIFSQSRLNEKLDEYEVSGVRFDPRFSGMNWTTAYAQENRWDVLPIGLTS